MVTEFTVGSLMWAAFIGHLLGDFIAQNDPIAKRKAVHTGWCLLHVLLYCLCMLGVLGWFDPRWWNWPWWLVIGVPHFLIDRFRLARRWMWLAAQEDFATGALAPWSVIVIDQVFHLVCLFATVILFAYYRL